jgi:hypothetical protein
MAAEAKAVSSSCPFAIFAFFWPKPQQDCWHELLHYKPWPVSLAREPAVATRLVAAMLAEMEELVKMGR